jgi:hypothetical protein
MNKITKNKQEIRLVGTPFPGLSFRAAQAANIPLSSHPPRTGYPISAHPAGNEDARSASLRAAENVPLSTTNRAAAAGSSPSSSGRGVVMKLW